ncbi:MAG: XRE family transcriptional regulator [Bacteroides sp.]|nr:XRE family transcriptional regulator [Eubacterium sp.]MCM1419366.1 XRE family transcriptional regulator [Roseburia sp.]MCM1463016.1 XRE family transcriptional regulator [Bacteroides sp.]
MEPNRRLKQLRIEKGLSLRELAERTGLSGSTIQRYESGKTEKLPLEKARLLAKGLDTTVGYLLELDNIGLEPAPETNVFLIPVFDSVSAGFGSYADSAAVAYRPTPIANAADAENYLWINVRGDSMSPKIEDGDRILVRRQSFVENGSVAVVLIEDEAVVKKVKYGRGWLELHSFNPYYPVRRFEREELEAIQIVGVVKEVSKPM